MLERLLSLSACSTLGVTGLVARLAMAPNTTRVYPTALLGRLVTRHRQSQDLIRNSGSLSRLIDHIKASTSVPVLLLTLAFPLLKTSFIFIITPAGKITRQGCSGKDKNPC